MIKLFEIQNKLETLSNDYARIYPKFYPAELAYIFKRAELMMQQVGLGSQQIRDAEVEKQIALTDEYTEYHKLKPEVDVIVKQIWIWRTIADLARASQWESKVEGE